MDIQAPLSICIIVYHILLDHNKFVFVLYHAQSIRRVIFSQNIYVTKERDRLLAATSSSQQNLVSSFH